MIREEDEFPLTTGYREKELTCPRCRGIIKIAVATSRNYGIEETITEESELSLIVKEQQEQLKRLTEVVISTGGAHKNLYNRCRKYNKILVEWAMFHGDENLLQLELRISKGDFDKDD